MDYKQIILGAFGFLLLGCNSANSNCPAPIIHTTAPNENISKIAKDYGCNTKDTEQLRKKYGDNIQPNQQIEISCTCATDLVTQAAPTSSTQATLPSLSHNDVDSAIKGTPNKNIQTIRNHLISGKPIEHLEITWNGTQYTVSLNANAAQPIQLNSYPAQIQACNQNKECQPIDIQTQQTNTAHTTPEKTPTVQTAPPTDATPEKTPPVQTATPTDTTPPNETLPPQKCAAISGKITDTTDVAIKNANVTVLDSGVSAYEHKSIRDNSNVLSNTKTDEQGHYQTTRPLSKGFKYSFLIEANDYKDKEYILDQTQGCSSDKSINIKLDKKETKTK